MYKEEEIKRLFHFAKAIGAILLFSSLYFLIFLAIDKATSIFVLITTIVVYFCIAQRFIEYLQVNLWEYVLEGKANTTPKKIKEFQKLTATLSWIDQVIYATSIFLGEFQILTVWLGFKIVQRLISCTVNSLDEYKMEGEKRNVYLIGNFVSLCLGIMLGVLIKNYFNFNYPSLVLDINNYLRI